MSGRPFKKSTMTKIIIVNILLFIIILCVYNQNRYKEEYEFENNSNVFSEIDRKFNIANIAKIIESPELDLEFICIVGTCHSFPGLSIEKDQSLIRDQGYHCIYVTDIYRNEKERLYIKKYLSMHFCIIKLSKIKWHPRTSYLLLSMAGYHHVINRGSKPRHCLSSFV